MINYNDRTVTLKLTRREVCELLLACSCCGMVAEEGASVEMWRRIHVKVNEQLNEFDEKNLEAHNDNH